MSFRSYIAQQAVSDTPEGDFVADAKGDRDLPDPENWDQLEDYLRLRGASREGINAAKTVWGQYAEWKNFR